MASSSRVAAFSRTRNSANAVSQLLWSTIGGMATGSLPFFPSCADTSFSSQTAKADTADRAAAPLTNGDDGRIANSSETQSRCREKNPVTAPSN